MRENEKTFFHLLRNKHPVKWIVVAHRQPRHCLRMGEADRQLGNSIFTTESNSYINVISDIFTVLYVRERFISCCCNKVNSTVFSGKSGHIDCLFTVVVSEPYLIHLWNCTIIIILF